MVAISSRATPWANMLLMNFRLASAPACRTSSRVAPCFSKAKFTVAMSGSTVLLAVPVIWMVSRGWSAKAGAAWRLKARTAAARNAPIFFIGSPHKKIVNIDIIPHFCRKMTGQSQVSCCFCFSPADSSSRAFCQAGQSPLMAPWHSFWLWRWVSTISSVTSPRVIPFR